MVSEDEKIKLNGNNAPWIEKYIAEAHEPSKEELKTIKNSFKSHNVKFKKIYAPIRHKIFAHKIAIEAEHISELFADAQIQEIDNILFANDHILEKIWQLFYNGCAEIGDWREQYDSKKTRVRDKALEVLNSMCEK